MTVKIKLSQGKFALIDECCEHLNQYKWYCSTWGYAVRHFYKEDKSRGLIRLNHAVSGYPLNGYQSDHINGNRLDNRHVNLRFVTPRENMQNKKCHREKTASSKYVGVYLHHVNKKKKIRYWRAQVYINGKKKMLGLFRSENDAAIAYQKAIHE